MLARYRAERPSVQVECVESNDDVPLLDDLRRGALDVAFALLPLDPDAFDYRELVHDEFLLVSRSGDSAARRVRSPADLAGLPLILHRTCRSAAALAAFLAARIDSPNIVFRSDDNAAIKEMVRAGLGVGLLPDLWAQLGGNEGLELTPLTGIVPPRVVVLAWRKDRRLTPAQESFVEIAAAASPPRLRRLAS